MMHYTEDEYRARETEAVVNKWRVWSCTQRAKREVVRDMKDKALALLIALGAMAIWAVALSLMVGAAAAR